MTSLLFLLIKTNLSLISEYVIADIKTKINSNQKLPTKWYYALPVVLLYGYLLFVVFRYAGRWFDF